jgi:hypothetical protein
MAQAVYVGSAVSGATAVTKEYPVASGVTVTDGDFVYLSSGRVTSASIPGVALLGQVVGKASSDPSDHSTTLSATGNAGGTVKVLVIVEPNAKYVMENDNVGTTFAVTHIGQCFDLTGATGAQLVDTSTAGTTGQLQCISFGYNGDSTKGIYIINEHKYKVNA